GPRAFRAAERAGRNSGVRGNPSGAPCLALWPSLLDLVTPATARPRRRPASAPFRGHVRPRGAAPAFCYLPVCACALYFSQPRRWLPVGGRLDALRPLASEVHLSPRLPPRPVPPCPDPKAS